MEFVGLDSLDSKLIYELDRDSRQPLSRIAKKLHTSVQRLSYRLSALENSGIIRNYIAVIDYKKLGTYMYFVCNLKIFGLNNSEEELIIKKIAADSKCTLAFRCEGAWDIMIGTVANDIFEAKETFVRLLAPFENHITEKLIVSHMGAYHYHQYILEDAYPRANACQESVTGGKAENLKHDDLDMKILELLSANARMPTLAIATKVGSVPETVAYRIKQLEKNKIINSYSVLLNFQKCGKIRHRIYVKSAGMTSEKFMGIVRYMERFPNMRRIIEVFEVYEFLFDLVSKSDEDMRSVVSNLKEKYKGSILGFDINKIYRVYKFTYFWTKDFKPPAQ